MLFMKGTTKIDIRGLVKYQLIKQNINFREMKRTFPSLKKNYPWKRYNNNALHTANTHPKYVIDCIEKRNWWIHNQNRLLSQKGIGHSSIGQKLLRL